MACKRNRVLELTEYLKSLNIDINIKKNKAQGHKGFFKVINNKCRIDISKGLDDENVLRTLVHEFAHFLHYSQDKSLKSLEFFCGNDWEELTEELISLTVDLIPKSTIAPLFEAKENAKKEINQLEASLHKIYPQYTRGNPNKALEIQIEKAGYKHLLKYDRVKLIGLFGHKLITIENVQNLTNEASLYLQIKSKKRLLKRINSKMNRLNKYYNSTSELFARAIEMYVFKPQTVKEKAPAFYQIVENNLKTKKFIELNNIVQILIFN